jgi:hypothetical protein
MENAALEGDHGKRGGRRQEGDCIAVSFLANRRFNRIKFNIPFFPFGR